MRLWDLASYVTLLSIMFFDQPGTYFLCSNACVPASYRPLMKEPSPIADMFPTDFKTEGSRASMVVLVPFAGNPLLSHSQFILFYSFFLHPLN